MSTPVDAPYLKDEASYLTHLQALRHEQWRQGVPREPRYPLGERPLTEYLQHWARQRADQAALIFYGRRVSWAELDAASDRFAALLVQRGLQPGDRVACFLPNCPQFLIVFLGVLKAGFVHVPVNPMFTEAELVYELQDTAAQVLVAHDQLLELSARALPQSQVRHCYATSFLDFLPEAPEGTLPAGLLTPRASHPVAEDLMSAMTACNAPVPQGLSTLDALAALNYTGGTTGMPKGCMHTQRNMLYTGGVMSSISADIGPEDVVVNFWPVFWVAGEDVAILLTVTTGATCVLMARWDPVGFVEAVQHNRASAAFMLVDNTVQVMELPAMTGDTTALRSLRQTLVASFVKKLNVDFRCRWQQLTGATLREAAWGMTETHSFDTVTRGWQDEDRDLLGRQIFCGLPVPGTEFKILEFGSQRLLPLDEEGELCVRSPSLLKGYWQREEATAEAIQDGWLRTGDLGMKIG